MNNIIKIIGLALFFNLALLPCKAQVVRTVHSSGGYTSTPVYEYNTVDVTPGFPGGSAALMRYINSQRRYPAEAYTQGIEGRVTCGFVVTADGSIKDVTVVKSAHPALDAEAIRVIESMPKWEAGIIGNRRVAVYCVLPVAFRL